MVLSKAEEMMPKSKQVKLPNLWEVTWEEIHTMLIVASDKDSALNQWVENNGIGDQTFAGFCGNGPYAKHLKVLPNYSYFIQDYSI
jgi:hypothetical protein